MAHPHVRPRGGAAASANLIRKQLSGRRGGNVFGATRKASACGMPPRKASACARFRPVISIHSRKVFACHQGPWRTGPPPASHTPVINPHSKDPNPQSFALQTALGTDIFWACHQADGQGSSCHLTAIPSICMCHMFGSPPRNVRRKVFNHNGSQSHAL